MITSSDFHGCRATRNGLSLSRVAGLKEEPLASLSEQMFETLKGAGYELTDESQIHLGLSAYMVAELVLSAAEDAGGARQSARPGRRRVGRNERCPWGSASSGRAKSCWSLR